MAELKTTIIVSTYPEDSYYNQIKEYLEGMRGYNKDFKVIFSDRDKKRTFAENNNLGAKKAKTPYVLFLNSDTKPEPGFYKEMENVIDSHKQFGVVGARLYFLNSFTKKVNSRHGTTILSAERGQIQHAGIAYNNKLFPYEMSWGENPDNHLVTEKRLVPSVTGACMMVRRDEFLEMGGFDENFKNGWEDTDLCLRYLEKEIFSFYQANAIVGHYFAGSQYTGDRFKHEDENFNYWYEKWHQSGKIFSLFLGIPQDTTKVDFGCGNNKKEGFFGIDAHPANDVDFLFNLERIGLDIDKLPFGDSSLEEINCDHVLENLENTLEIMNEFHRILKPNGWLYLTIPHAFSWSGFASPLHKKYFIPETFTEYFASDKREEKLKSDPQIDLIRPWHIEKIETTSVPEGVNPFSIQREFKVKMKPLKS